MSQTLKVSSIWRVIKDVDLEAISAAAAMRFLLLIVSEDGEDAARLRALLSPDGDASPHPWLVTASAREGIPELPAKPEAAVLVTRSEDLPPGMVAARDALGRGDVPVLTVVIAQRASRAAVVWPGEAARTIVPALDAMSAVAVGDALLTVGGEPLRMALARQLPLVRPAVYNALVEETARANAGFAFTTGLAEAIPVLTAPLNLGDVVVLTKNQLIMCYRIALVSGRSGDPRELLSEIVGVLGSGLLFRQVARQLVGLIPVIGLLPKVAIAYGGTWAIGRAMVGWASEGRAVTSEAVRAFTREGMERGTLVARRLLEQARAARRAAGSRWDRVKAAAMPRRSRETPGKRAR